GRYQPQVLTLAAEMPGVAGGDGADDDGESATAAVAAVAAARRSSRKAGGRGATNGSGGAADDARASPDFAVWETLGIVCSLNERRADEATRDVEAWLKCQYMKERVGEQYRGRITGVAPFGI